MWGLWKARNPALFVHKSQIPAQIISSTLAAANESESSSSRPTRRNQLEPQLTKWSPPLSGRLKINTDAASFPDGTSSLGFVIRTETGSVTLAGMKHTQMAGNNTLLEALALRF
ncbi:hypothetical protein ACS0TY_010888 [Phlomoides rotata]